MTHRSARSMPIDRFWNEPGTVRWGNTGNEAVPEAAEVIAIPLPALETGIYGEASGGFASWGSPVRARHAPHERPWERGLLFSTLTRNLAESGFWNGFGTVTQTLARLPGTPASCFGQASRRDRGVGSARERGSECCGVRRGSRHVRPHPRGPEPRVEHRQRHTGGTGASLTGRSRCPHR